MNWRKVGWHTEGKYLCRGVSMYVCIEWIVPPLRAAAAAVTATTTMAAAATATAATAATANFESN